MISVASSIDGAAKKNQSACSIPEWTSPIFFQISGFPISHMSWNHLPDLFWFVSIEIEIDEGFIIILRIIHGLLSLYDKFGKAGNSC
jgi:hypothetical protein